MTAAFAPRERSASRFRCRREPEALLKRLGASQNAVGRSPQPREVTTHPISNHSILAMAEGFAMGVGECR